MEGRETGAGTQDDSSSIHHLPIIAGPAFSFNNRKARFYELTRLGRRQLERETASWQRLSGAINQVLGATAEHLP